LIATFSGSGGFVLDRRVQLILALGAAVTSTAWSQEPHKFTAREIFYGDPAPPPPAKSQAQPVKPPKTTAHSSGNPTRKQPRKTEPESTVSEGTPALNQNVADDPATHVQLVTSTTNTAPLGMRVSVLKVVDKGQTVEMDPDTAFRNGDQLRLNVEVSDTGYLYILNRGSSGTWMPLFPSPEIPNASNLVQRGVKYGIPPGYGYTIHDPAGTEKLFVIFSRKPQLDMEALTDDVSRQDKPASNAPKLPQTYALNRPPMTDASVDQLRTTYSRDLIIEKVAEDTGPQKEKAMYVAVPSGGPDARVVLDVQIKHP
jgi:Domain of unknown function (DUF4384)